MIDPFGEAPPERELRIEAFGAFGLVLHRAVCLARFLRVGARARVRVELGAANARPWSQTCCRLGMFLLSCASLCSRTSHTVLATQHELRVDVVVFGRLTLATSPTHSRRTPRAWRPHRAPVASLRPAWRPVGRSCSRSSSWAIAGAPPTPPRTNSTKKCHEGSGASRLWLWGAVP